MVSGKGIALMLGGAAALYGGVYVARQATLLKKTKFEVLKVNKKGISLQGVTLELVSFLTNESDIDLEVYGQLYYIYFNGKYVGVITSNEYVKVAKKSTSRINLLLFLDAANLLKAGLTTNIKELGNNTLSIKGKIKTKTFGILFNGIPIKLDFKLSELM